VQTLGFVGRRLVAEPIALVCAMRPGIGDHVLAGASQLPIRGLADHDARALLLSHVHGPIDDAICDQIVAESHGNPLALAELPRTWTTSALAGGFGLPDSQSLASKIEESYERRLARLPFDTQLLVLAAAAEPLGDPALLHGATERLGIDVAAADPAADAGLLSIGARVEFAHPLVRSAAYRTAAAVDRHRVHRALAEATDSERDPDRRAWHFAQGTARPDEEVAAELERSAGRAQARGGLAAAAAFLERAAALSPEPAKRARRALEAAEAKQLAGAPQAASALLATAVDGPLDGFESALAQRLQGQIALDLRRGGRRPCRFCLTQPGGSKPLTPDSHATPTSKHCERQASAVASAVSSSAAQPRPPATRRPRTVIRAPPIYCSTGWLYGSRKATRPARLCSCAR
jgi:hypothetical protein